MTEPSAMFELRRRDGTKLIYGRCDFDFLEVTEPQVIVTRKGYVTLPRVDVYAKTGSQQVLGYTEYEFLGERE